mmetsp:Transcript_8839/g.16177  ORF Transcript_8839/g.16177 Transcript_8839/m.16177 type:complete len:93 (+) Transcript_8839:95-373(+)
MPTTRKCPGKLCWRAERVESAIVIKLKGKDEEEEKVELTHQEMQNVHRWRPLPLKFDPKHSPMPPTWLKYCTFPACSPDEAETNPSAIHPLF